MIICDSYFILMVFARIGQAKRFKCSV